jgi:hypothetical protein
MKNTLVALSCAILLATSLAAQKSPAKPASTTTPAPAADTTIYSAPDAAPFPLLASCRIDLHAGWTIDSVRRCGETQLLRILAQNIRYPIAAREGNIQGVVVAQGVVETSGKITHLKILKDIGGGCGPEALRVLNALDSLGLRFQPGQMDNKPVRSLITLPLRFRLTESLPYYLTEEGDTVYTTVDRSPQFRGGDDSLATFIINRLDYPRAFIDSCRAGVIELSLIVGPKGSVKVENQLDFNNLGFDFQFQAIRLANRTAGMWTPATYQDKPVPTTIPLRTLFKSAAPGCTTANERFDRAMLLAAEGVALSDQEKPEEALAKWNEALILQPNNTELLYYRGTVLLNTGKKEEACADYNRIKELLGGSWFEPVRRLVCGW